MSQSNIYENVVSIGLRYDIGEFEDLDICSQLIEVNRDRIYLLDNFRAIVEYKESGNTIYRFGKVQFQSRSNFLLIFLYNKGIIDTGEEVVEQNYLKETLFYQSNSSCGNVRGVLMNMVEFYVHETVSRDAFKESSNSLSGFIPKNVIDAIHSCHDKYNLENGGSALNFSSYKRKVKSIYGHEYSTLIPGVTFGDFTNVLDNEAMVNISISDEEEDNYNLYQFLIDSTHSYEVKNAISAEDHFILCVGANAFSYVGHIRNTEYKDGIDKYRYPVCINELMVYGDNGRDEFGIYFENLDKTKPGKGFLYSMTLDPDKFNEWEIVLPPEPDYNSDYISDPRKYANAVQRKGIENFYLNYTDKGVDTIAFWTSRFDIDRGCYPQNTFNRNDIQRRGRSFNTRQISPEDSTINIFDSNLLIRMNEDIKYDVSTQLRYQEIEYFFQGTTLPVDVFDDGEMGSWMIYSEGTDRRNLHYDFKTTLLLGIGDGNIVGYYMTFTECGNLIDWIQVYEDAFVGNLIKERRISTKLDYEKMIFNVKHLLMGSESTKMYRLLDNGYFEPISR